MSMYPPPPVIPRKAPEAFQLLRYRSNRGGRKLSSTPGELLQQFKGCCSKLTGAEINKPLANGYGLIHFAIAFGDIACMAVLLQHEKLNICRCLDEMRMDASLDTLSTADSSEIDKQSKKLRFSPLAMCFMDNNEEMFSEFCRIAPSTSLDAFFADDSGDRLIKDIFSQMKGKYIRFLLNSGLTAFLNTHHNKLVEYVFKLAERKGRALEVMEILIDHKVDIQIQYNDENILHKCVQANNPEMAQFLLQRFFKDPTNHVPYHQQESYKLLRDDTNTYFTDPICLIFTESRDNLNASIRLLELFIEYGYNINKKPSNMNFDIVNLTVQNIGEKELDLLDCLFHNSFRFTEEFNLGALMEIAKGKYIRDIVKEMKTQSESMAFDVIKKTIEDCFIQPYSMVTKLYDTPGYPSSFMYLCKYLISKKYDINQPVKGNTMNMVEILLVYIHDQSDMSVVDFLFKSGAKMQPPQPGDESTFFVAHDYESWSYSATSAVLNHLRRNDPNLLGLFVTNFVNQFASCRYFFTDDWDIFSTSSGCFQQCLSQYDFLKKHGFDINVNIKDEVQNILEHAFIKYQGRDRTKLLRKLVSLGGVVRPHVAAGYVEFFKLKDNITHVNTKELKLLKTVFPVGEMDIFDKVMKESLNMLFAKRLARRQNINHDISIVKYIHGCSIDFIHEPLDFLADVNVHSFLPLMKKNLLQPLSVLDVCLVSLAHQSKTYQRKGFFNPDLYKAWFNCFLKEGFLDFTNGIYFTSVSPVLKALCVFADNLTVTRRILGAAKNVTVNLSLCPWGTTHTLTTNTPVESSPVETDEEEDEDDLSPVPGFCFLCGCSCKVRFACTHCSFLLCPKCEFFYSTEPMKAADIPKLITKIRSPDSRRHSRWLRAFKLDRDNFKTDDNPEKTLQIEPPL